MHLQLLAFEGGSLRHDFVDVLEVFGAVAQRRPHHEAEGRGEDDGCRGNLDISMCHKDFWEETSRQNSPDYPADASSRKSKDTVAIGSPTTFEYDPSIPVTNRDASPWTA